jgi:AAA domain-containing protein/bifunctional DNA primase/polymerase-like protein
VSSRAAVNLAVKEAYDAGLCVVPPREDGSKAPAAWWKEYQEKRPDLDVLREYYRGERHGLGTLGGPVSGELEVFEFETADVYRNFRVQADLAGLEALVDKIESGYLERAPRGGYHWLWRTSKAGANHKLAMGPGYETLIETRATGGYCILAPSYGPVHPTGNPYVRLAGAFDTIAFVDADDRAALFRVAVAFDKVPKKDDQRVWAPAGGSKGDRPGDDFEVRGDWAGEVLEAAGWAMVSNFSAQQYWRRPGKDQGHSAVLHLDTDLFVPFSSSTPFPVTEVGYGKFSAYAWLHHGGDFSAAAVALKRQGYGEAREERVWTPPPARGMRGSELFDHDWPPIETLPILGEPGMVMERGSNLLYAYPKTGKTEVVCELLHEWVALDKEIVYLTEEPLGFWKPRLHRFKQPRDFWDPIIFAPALGWGIVGLFDFLLEIDSFDILVVDTLRNTCGFQEGEGDKDVGRVVLPLIALAREREATLFALYHARKMPGEDGRDISGHHSLYGAFDRALQLRKISGDDNEMKRRVTVSGRLITPETPNGMTYEMTPDGRFRSLEVKRFTGWGNKSQSNSQVSNVCSGEGDGE